MKSLINLKKFYHVFKILSSDPSSSERASFVLRFIALNANTFQQIKANLNKEWLNSKLCIATMREIKLHLSSLLEAERRVPKNLSLSLQCRVQDDENIFEQLDAPTNEFSAP